MRQFSFFRFRFFAPQAVNKCPKILLLFFFFTLFLSFFLSFFFLFLRCQQMPSDPLSFRHFGGLFFFFLLLFFFFFFSLLFLDATTHLYQRSCPSVRPYVPCYFRTTNMAIFEGKKLSNDIINNGIMSDDEVVASDVPQRYLFCV